MREQGSILAHETGSVTAYALDSAQDKGTLFIRPGDMVRKGVLVESWCCMVRGGGWCGWGGGGALQHLVRVGR